MSRISVLRETLDKPSEVTLTDGNSLGGGCVFGVRLSSDLQSDWHGSVGVSDCHIGHGYDTPRVMTPALRIPSAVNLPSYLEVHTHDAGLHLTVAGVASFLITDTAIRYRPSPGVLQSTLLDVLFGPAVCLWLERNGRLVLHGSVISHGQKGFAFLGPSGTGKSTLALAFMKHGATVVADDHVVLVPAPDEIRAAPTVPWLKAWPDSLETLGVDPMGIDRVHPDVTKRRMPLAPEHRVAAPVPLHAIFVVRRDSGTVRPAITRLSPATGLVELVRLSSVPKGAAAAGLSSGRLARLAEVVERVGVWSLDVPSDLSGLGDVCSTVFEHFVP